MEQEAFSRGRFVELCAQPAFQVLENHGHKRDISNLVTHEGIAHKLWPQRTQVYHTGPAHERADEPNHEINRVVRRQNAEVADPRPEWVPGRERLALLKIVLV